MTARVVAVPTTVTCPSCGYTNTYGTPALAAAHFPRHSCENHLAIVARAERVEAALTREGVKRDCQCAEAKHVHGTRTAYVVDKCRCRACTTASATAQAIRSKQQAYGRYDSGRVDAEPVQEHIRYLMANGISAKRLATLADLSHSAVSAIIYGRTERGHNPYPRVQAVTAEKILAIKPTLDNMAAGRVIDSTGTLRRLQALVTIGWSMSRLGEHINVTPGNMVKLMNSTQTTAGRARQVKALYEKLWNQPQQGHDQRSRISANRSRSYAKKRGWYPPMAWDDDTIDNPATMPDMGETLDRTTTRIENIEHLLTTGHLFWEIAQRLGTTEATLERFLDRNNRRDIITTARTQERNREYRRAS